MSLEYPSVEWHLRRLTGEGVLSGVDSLHDTFSLFLVQCVIILSICRILGLLGSRFNQPQVIFEIIGGILLGPSAIGRNQAYLTKIFPTNSLPLLSVVANLGLVLYLFIVGMELDPKLLATHAKKAGAIAFLGMAIPFALGIGISQTMFDTLQKNDPKYANVSFISFFVFIGTAMSITAFPVLARILKEGGLIYTTAGSMAMGAAALNDAAAWCLLVLAISLANSANLNTAGFVFLSVVAFAVVLIMAFRPLWWKLVAYVENQNSPSMSNGLFCLTLILVFLCAWTTALIGLDSIFGAFLFGLIMPRDSHLFKECNEKIEELVLGLTLPLYFALSGLKTDVTQINTADQGAMVVLVCVIATLGKYIGAGAAAYFGGMNPRESCVIAALMNTRGLVELIVLNLGVSAGILSTKTFSVMVIMCLVTTFMTCPVVNCIYPVHLRVLASEGMHELVKTEEGAPSDEYPDTFEESKSVNEGALGGMLAKGARLGVIVDRMEHLQGLMDLLSCFVPFTSDSKLAVTAIRAFEPSLTEKDVFIGLNSEGRLINVEEERTTMYDDGTMPYSPAIKQSPQELLPLSMFLRAMGGSVKAYRVRGDPNEFPQQIRSLTGKNCNLIIFPWRASQYLERLFWHSLRTVAAPIALVVMLDTILPATIADIAGGASGSDIEKEYRARSQSVAVVRPREHSSSPDPDTAVDYIPGSAVESRTASPIPLSSTPFVVQGGIRRPVNGHNSVIVEDHISSQCDSSRQSISVKTVLAVVSGSTMCASVLPLALRFAERSSVHVTVLIATNTAPFSDTLNEALTAFTHSAKSVSNIYIETLPMSHNIADIVITRCSESLFDIVIFGHYVEPVYDIMCEEHTDHVPAPPVSRSHRSSSVTFSVPPIDVPEMRRLAGVPETLQNSPLAYPELGLLGNRIRERGLSPYIMILHEPDSYNRQRSRTMWGGVSPTGSLSPPARTVAYTEPPTVEDMVGYV